MDFGKRRVNTFCAATSVGVSTIISRMAEDTLHHLKAWRLFRKLTQQQLADLVEPPSTKSVIAALENGQNGVSAKWLHKLAKALQTTPGFLLDHDPNDIDPEWTRATEAVPVKKRADAIAVLKVISKD